MMLGALMDAGAPLPEIQAGIDSLGLANCRLETETVQRHGFRALKLRVRHEPEHAHRHLSDITKMIGASQLNESQKQLATKIFTRLAEAEALVHGSTIDKVHFHEVGAIDSIADIVGTAIAWDLLQIERLVSSPVPTGHGTIKIAHGVTSIPAPATAELLKRVPLLPSHVPHELTTPTGAAILSALTPQFGGPPAMTVESTGCGAGDRDLEQQANVLRVLIGQASELPQQAHIERDEICVLETCLDDCTGEVIGFCVERLFAAGALDAYTTPVQMKKSRPGVILTVLCIPADKPLLENIVLTETTSLGIRSWTAHRSKLPRAAHQVETRWGSVAGKLAVLPDGTQCFAPEYESCRQVAVEHSVPVQRVMDEAVWKFSNSSSASKAR
jgi:uncharacterized protein (TIGR00299 family) protein